MFILIAMETKNLYNRNNNKQLARKLVWEALCKGITVVGESEREQTVSRENTDEREKANDKRRMKECKSFSYLTTFK